MKLLASVAFAVALLVGQAAADDNAVKQLYHVKVPKVILDAARREFGGELDIWEATLVGPATVEADIYATESAINKFYATKQSKTLLREGAPLIEITRDPVNTAEALKASAAATAACTARTSRHLEEINAGTKYTDNAFFNCWRKADEVFAFFDKLVAENAQYFSKINQISTTVEGRSIPAYKISTGGSGKRVIYVQGLIHAREWHAGSTTFYTIAALLDGLRSNDPTLMPLLNAYDWVFVPIVNLDGYLYTHASSNGRLWRKNRRRISSSTYGIDLNRNFGPKEFFGLGGEGPSAETYPGPKPLSEPETAGIFQFLKTLPLAGALDVHAYSGLVLRPFGNQENEAPAPFGAKLKTLGDRVKAAIEVNNTFRYTSQTAADLYLAYGSFMDSIFLEFNKTATLSFEMEGRGFVQSESVIRPGGQHVFQGIVQFAKELPAYYS
ncbi:hypothetical protein PINS_up009455 [Pythium insidiosum]|nr:hypothetical protein PINS_up009455 [Pythium insidiosum]